jgi:hypothetical protein
MIILGTIISGLTSLVSTIGPVVAKIATTIVTKLPEIATTIMKVAEVISEVATILGLTNHETPEVIGAKMQQEGTRGRLDDESMEEYLDYLREEIKLDKEKFLSMSDEERVKSTAIGIGALSQTIDEKFGVKLSGDFIVDMNKMQMTAREIASYVQHFESKGIESMDSLTDFLKGKLSDEDKRQVYDVITKVENELSPRATQADVNDKIETMKDAISVSE